MRPAARGGQDAGITQPGDHFLADPCRKKKKKPSRVASCYGRERLGRSGHARRGHNDDGGKERRKDCLSSLLASRFLLLRLRPVSERRTDGQSEAKLSPPSLAQRYNLRFSKSRHLFESRCPRISGFLMRQRQIMALALGLESGASGFTDSRRRGKDARSNKNAVRGF